MRPIGVDEMKQVELELVGELDRVCRSQDIPYFLAYGSLLGAMRHKGFIPWDDDMDVQLFRRDYERLLAGFDTWKSHERFKLAIYRDNVSIYPFAKLIDTTTVVYENFVDKRRANGIWIDLFPLDNVSVDTKGAVRRAMRKNAWLYLVRGFVVADTQVGSNAAIRLAKRVVHPLVAKRNPVAQAGQIDENIRNACYAALQDKNEIRWNDYPHPTETVADLIGWNNLDHVCKSAWFEPVDVSFEGMSLMAPASFDEVLTAQYGDWRTPPSESEREIHTFKAYRL